MFNQAVTVLTILANGFIALLLFKNNYRSATNILLVFMSVVLMSWTLFTHLALEPGTEVQRLFWVRLVMATTVPFGPLIYIFSKVFPGKTFTISRFSIITCVVSVVTTSLVAMSPAVFSDLVNTADGKFTIIPSYGMILYALNFIGFMSLGFYILVKKYRRSNGILKIQLSLFLFGLIISCILLTFTNFLAVVLWSSIDLARLGPPSTLILVFFMTYAIIKHRLLDIRVFIVRSIGYTFALLLLVSLNSFGLIMIQSRMLNREITSYELIITLTLTIFIAFSFNPLQKAFSLLTKKIFYKDSYDSEKLLHELTLIMASTFLLEELTRKLLTLLLSTVNIKSGMMILIEDEQVYWVVSEGYKKVPSIDEKDIQTILQQKNNLLIYEEQEDEKIKSIFQKYETKLISRFINDGKAVGLLCLGEKLSGELYTEADQTLISIFSAEAAIAIQNAKSYEEIRRFNITLEEEVENATKRLVKANEKLQELDKLKDEFVSIASHELRTPMVSIKNYVWMTLAGKGGKINRKQKFYLDRAYDSANRMTKLINDLLNISRIESGRIILNVEKIDILKLAEAIVSEVKPRAEQLEVKLILNKQAHKKNSDEQIDIPPAIADHDKIAEVLVNLLGNSLKFTPPKGKITVSFEVDEKENEVIVHVSDTGVGLSKEQIPKLFKKFGMIKETYRSKSEAAQGTGLGLYVSKSIIELHGEKIWVESEGFDKGSVFSFSLSLYSDTELHRLQKKFQSSSDAGIIRTPLVSGQ